ncbi:MAG: HAD family hydrolase [Treponema sp.]|nr:HAD family hydrolase [Treponema sp.]
MYKGIKAVAFDIDGTLYPSWRLYVRIAGHFIRHVTFFVSYNKVRNVLHRTAPLADFFEYQARLLAEEMHVSPEFAKDKINDICYEGLKPYFFKVKPYPNVYATFCALKSAGLKLGILSDFPPEQKGRLWGLRSLCDVCIGSEESGALKPSIYPFGILAKKLGVKPEEILYVGNSLKYDVRGANNYGMKSAYLLKGLRRLFNIRCREADISFRTYKELLNIILNSPQ